MSLTVGQHEPARGPYILAPKGYFPATLVDIRDLGEVETEYKGQKKKQFKVLLRWELEGPVLEDGRPVSISQRYTLSAYENSKLRQHVSSWQNKNFSEEEFKSFDLETLLNQRCQLFIEHRAKDGKTFANVVSIGEAPQIDFAYFAAKIEAAWTHPALDAIKTEALAAKQKNLISPVELKALAEKSQARRADIDKPVQLEEVSF